MHGGARVDRQLDHPVAGTAQGPLAGLSFAAKDNIDVAGVPTTAGCPAFAYRPAAHATWCTACSTLVRSWRARPTSTSSPAA